MIALLLAHALVKGLRFALWRDSLGRVRSMHASPPSPADDAEPEHARMIGAHVERAAARLPVVTLCLARAVAVQWLLCLRRQPSTLVLASHRTDRTTEHAFHAWVEIGDHFVIGHCDRAAYRRVLSIDQGGSHTADA